MPFVKKVKVHEFVFRNIYHFTFTYFIKNYFIIYLKDSEREREKGDFYVYSFTVQMTAMTGPQSDYSQELRIPSRCHKWV